MDAVEGRDEIIVRQAVADVEEVVEAEVVAGDDEHALFRPDTLGKAIYELGWKWSDHVRTGDGPATCEVEHVVLVVEWQCAVAMDDGETTIMKPGDFVYVPPGHDSWVVGDEPHVSLHFLGLETYAK